MKPKYRWLVEILERKIDAMGPNEMIPSERELARRYRMSRMTVRKAIDTLVDQNKLYRISKVGTFTASKKLYKRINTFSGFSSEVRLSGGEPSSELIEFSLQHAGKEVASRLNIEDDALIYRVVRLKKKDGVPVMVDESHFPKSIITLTESIVRHSIYDHVTKKRDYEIVSASQRFRSTFLKPVYQEYMNLPPDKPVTNVETTVYLSDGRIFEYTNAYIDTDRYEIIVKSYQ